MKTFTIIIFASLLAISQAATAQTTTPTFRGGITGGVVASQVSGDNSAGFNKLGLYVGPFANFNLREKLLFQMEISYIQKGSRENPTEENNYYSYRLKLDYIELPFMFRYSYSDKLDFEVGLAYSVLIRTYEEFNQQEVDDRPFNTHNSSLIAGIYYKLDDTWSVNFRTSNSITPIRKHKSGQTYRLNFGQTNNLLTLGLFYTM